MKSQPFPGSDSAQVRPHLQNLLLYLLRRHKAKILRQFKFLYKGPRNNKGYIFVLFSGEIV